jgi:hypothetical protein
VNYEQFRAFLWLHWRLRINQIKRAGTLNAILLALLIAGAAITGLVLFAVFFLLGVFLLGRISPVQLMLVWDGLAFAFLFGWCMGVLTELQRSEVVALNKFLHLPISLRGIFVFNYLNSLVSVSGVIFVPALLGCSIGLAFSRGAAMLLLLPLLAGFLLMVTALTYQFQGWLASLMVNKRRRRTIIVFLTIGMIMTCQAPQLFNFYGPWRRGQVDEAEMKKQAAEEMLKRSLAAHSISLDQYQKKLVEVEEQYLKDEKTSELGKLKVLEGWARLVNTIVPPGWLPLSAMELAKGEYYYPLLGFLGLTAIGGASLWRSYRTTLRLYTGQFTAGARKAAAITVAADVRKPRERILVEKELPWLSEQSAAIALAGFRALLRAPEAKMILLSPIIFLVILAGAFFRGGSRVPEAARPALVVGGMSMILLTMTQLLGNQFGFDRGGFRVFVLSPARRKDILLGKNLAIAPVALGMGVLVAVLVQVMLPMRIDFCLLQFPQLLSIYLLFCLLANSLSILAPSPIAAGTLKPTNIRLVTVLLQASLLLLMPPLAGLTLLPVGLQLLLDLLSFLPGVPVGLLFGLLMCLGIGILYRYLVGLQGLWLQAREQQILEIVTTKSE